VSWHTVTLVCLVLRKDREKLVRTIVVFGLDKLERCLSLACCCFIYIEKQNPVVYLSLTVL